MTNRLELRSALRRRLEDTTVNPLWGDMQLNEALGNGLVRLGSRIPKEATVAVVIAADLDSIPVTPTLTRDRILRVLDSRGDLIREEIEVGRSRPGEARAWRWWNGSLKLSRPLGTAETWSIEYRAVRTMPADDVTTVDIAIEDAPILIALAAESILRIRAVEEMKRMGNSRWATAMAEDAMKEADRLISERRRNIRSGVLMVGG